MATFEFPHLLRLIEENQFDTIYHEHFSYLSLTAVERVFERNGLRVFDVEELPTHGGSLRVFAQRADSGRRAASDAVDALLGAKRGRPDDTALLRGFQARVEQVKDDFVSFLLEREARRGKRGRATAPRPRATRC